ncbi:MAG: septal ring lytic transglycosylase RlpA family protein [Robiginitomaculum sp.]|nr:septal ring lytic transglycosylase RlpA family protein [Robiginitomaculum sp.]
MTDLKLNRLVKLGATVIIGLTTFGLGACSTTSGTMMAQGAPITYKIDQGIHQQATLTTPYASASPKAMMPRAVTPAPVRPLESPVRPALPMLPNYSAPKLDMKSVDTALYAHQRVGKPYTIFGKRYTPKHQPHYDKVGTASWYGPKFHGKLTANGETYDMDGITAAHKTLPLNSMVMVTNVETGKSMKVRVNDRGPFVGDRIIDLSRAVANQLGLFKSGLGQVRVQYAGPADPNATDSKPVTLPKSVDSPRLKPAPAPEIVANLPKYRPLRDLGARPAPAALPLEQQPQQFQSPPRFPFEPQASLPQPQVLIPQPTQPHTLPQNAEMPAPPTGNIEDGPITLTIKGPIHMASDKNDGTYAKAKYIPAVNYTNIPAER